MATNYYDEYSKTPGKDRALGAGSGALKGAGTGALAGTLIAPGIGTVIGAGVGAVGGGLVGALGEKKTLTPYEEENLKRLTDLERRMEEGALGLTDEEKQLLYATAEDRERQARTQARSQRSAMLESAYAGSGQARSDMAQAEEFAVDQMRKTGIEVAKKDLEKAEMEEQEYWARLGAMSLREAQENKKRDERKKQIYSDLNEFLVGEITTGGIGGGGTASSTDILGGLAKQYDTDENEMRNAIAVLQENPELLQLLVSAGG
jgi:hypothetical protein